MRNRAPGLLLIGICLAACSSGGTGDAVEPTRVETTRPPQPTTIAAVVVTPTAAEQPTTVVTEPRQNCGRAPIIQLRSDLGAVAADLVYFQESSPMCGINVDGAAMFDSSFRPDSVVVATDGNFDIVVGEPGDVTVDIRELLPGSGVGASALGGPPLVATDGVYPLALPDSGCFLVTIEFDTGTRDGQFIALAASDTELC